MYVGVMTTTITIAAVLQGTTVAEGRKPICRSRTNTSTTHLTYILEEGAAGGGGWVGVAAEDGRSDT